MASPKRADPPAEPHPLRNAAQCCAVPHSGRSLARARGPGRDERPGRLRRRRRTGDDPKLKGWWSPSQDHPSPIRRLPATETPWIPPIPTSPARRGEGEGGAPCGALRVPLDRHAGFDDAGDAAHAGGDAAPVQDLVQGEAEGGALPVGGARSPPGSQFHAGTFAVGDGAGDGRGEEGGAVLDDRPHVAQAPQALRAGEAVEAGVFEPAEWKRLNKVVQSPGGLASSVTNLGKRCRLAAWRTRVLWCPQCSQLFASRRTFGLAPTARVFEAVAKS
eukprot:gene11866-biopygen5157